MKHQQRRNDMKKHERLAIETKQNWEEEIEKIPYINFPSDWKVRVIPPVNDAVVRFHVVLPCGRWKSIYLDCRDSLGSVGSPYWEVYPYCDDVGRCSREDVTRLLEMIADTQGGEG